MVNRTGQIVVEGFLEIKQVKQWLPDNILDLKRFHQSVVFQRNKINYRFKCFTLK